MSILKHLILPNQPFADSSNFNSEFLYAKIEAAACVYKKLILVMNHISQEYMTYNFNEQIYPITGVNPYQIDLEKVYSHIGNADQTLMWKYLEIINHSFTNTNHKTDEASYFSVDFMYINSKKIDACTAKIVPYLYDKNDNLLATLCIIEPISFAGSAILRKHLLGQKKTLIFSNTTKQFDLEETPFLSHLECRILLLSGQGIKEKEIAKQLEMTLPGIKRIKTQIFEKLNVCSISEAIYTSYKRGYLGAGQEI